MKIQRISLSNNNINYRGTKQITKMALGAISAGIAATVGKYKAGKEDNIKLQDEFEYEDLSDIEEIDDNIFDEEYYQAYYNIDLNLAHNRAFRDNELFNPLRDTENYEYKKYDEEDVKYADNLNYKNLINEYTTKFKLSDTDFGDLRMPDAVTQPYKSQQDGLRVQERFVKLNKRIQQLKINDDVKEIILQTCKRETNGFSEVDFELVNIALDLYENERIWFCAKGDITDIIDILREYDPDSKEYKSICNFITAGIHAHQSNNIIYRRIMKIIDAIN